VTGSDCECDRKAIHRTYAGLLRAACEPSLTARSLAAPGCHRAKHAAVGGFITISMPLAEARPQPTHLLAPFIDGSKILRQVTVICAHNMA